MTTIWWFLVGLVFVSFWLPAWALLRETKPAGVLEAPARAFHGWLVSSVGWLMAVVSTGILLGIGRLVLDEPPAGWSLLVQIHVRSALGGWLFPAAAGGILWLAGKKESRGLRAACWGWNALLFVNFSALLFAGPNVLRPFDFVSALAAGILLAGILFSKAPLSAGPSRRLAFTFVRIFGGIGLAAALLFSASKLWPGTSPSAWSLAGEDLLWLFGALGLPLVFAHPLMEEVTGVPLHSRRLLRMSAGGWAILGGLYSLRAFGGRFDALSTVAAVGFWLPAGFMAANVWKTAEHLKEQTVEELAARWKSLGSWMPSTAAARWLEAGWMCFFAGALLWSGTSFRTVSDALQPSSFSTGLLHVLALGGGAGVFLSLAYVAWSGTALPVSERVADIAYWHSLAGGLLLFLGFVVGGLVQAAQKTLPWDVIAAWRRPFSAAIIAGGFLVLSGVFIVWLDLLRTKPKCLSKSAQNA
ncbi:MAG: hypothetical protein HY548_06515 [Elusimicrobia bacterium]|nr:hypothetical protein [Elusimicrobiota bacterium]